ncbi:hypothetical protein QUB63_03195 [Microcoleus sp. ARI1-B5]
MSASTLNNISLAFWGLCKQGLALIGGAIAIASIAIWNSGCKRSPNPLGL